MEAFADIKLPDLHLHFDFAIFSRLCLYLSCESSCLLIPAEFINQHSSPENVVTTRLQNVSIASFITVFTQDAATFRYVRQDFPPPPNT